MTIYLLFGMNEPMHGGDLLAFLIVGLIGFAICYIHRYFIFAVMPLFLWLTYYIITGASSRSLNEKVFGYIAILIDFAAIIVSSFLSWKKYKNTQTKLS